MQIILARTNFKQYTVIIINLYSTLKFTKLYSHTSVVPLACDILQTITFHYLTSCFHSSILFDDAIRVPLNQKLGTHIHLSLALHRLCSYLLVYVCSSVLEPKPLKGIIFPHMSLSPRIVLVHSRHLTNIY